MDTSMLEKASLLAAVIKILVDYVTNPIKTKKPDLDMWYLPYVTFVLGGAASVLAGINLFPSTFIYPQVGIVLTAALVGGGSNLMNDLSAVVEKAKKLMAQKQVKGANKPTG